MEPEHVDRRLAAILTADAAGYSRLMRAGKQSSNAARDHDSGGRLRRAPRAASQPLIRAMRRSWAASLGFMT